MRVLTVVLLLVICTSCSFFSSEKGKNAQNLDTIINFKKVDASPFFEKCKTKIDTAKTNCFRKTIHTKIAEDLVAHQLKVKDSINEVVEVYLLISSEGKVIFQKLNSSERIQKEIPKLDSLLQVSVEKLPEIYPATKRGIPVTTQYSLPIRIQLKE